MNNPFAKKRVEPELVDPDFCPGHVARDDNNQVCRHCGINVRALDDRPDPNEDEAMEGHGLNVMSAFQTVMSMVFGNNVAQLPAPAFGTQRIGKRAMRRARGRAKGNK